MLPQDLTYPLHIADRPIRVILIGYGSLGVELLNGLLGFGDLIQVVGVFPWSAIPAQKHFKNEALEKEFYRMIAKNKIRFIQCPSINGPEFAAILSDLKPHILMIASWGEIIKKKLLSTPGVLFVNTHPSLLPLFRGANPYVYPIRNGDAQTGVTIHLVDPGVDTGPIIYQSPLPLLGDETGESLRVKCSHLAREMMPQWMIPLSEGTLMAREQDHSLATYAPHIHVNDLWIRWWEHPILIERNIRAMHPWNESFTAFGEKPTLVSFKFGKLIHTTQQPNLKEAAKAHPQFAGCIVATARTGLVATTIDPDYFLLLQHPKIHAFSPLLRPFLTSYYLRIGQQLYTPRQDGV